MATKRSVRLLFGAPGAGGVQPLDTDDTVYLRPWRPSGLVDTGTDLVVPEPFKATVDDVVQLEVTAGWAWEVVLVTDRRRYDPLYYAVQPGGDVDLRDLQQVDPRTLAEVEPDPAWWAAIADLNAGIDQAVSDAAEAAASATSSAGSAADSASNAATSAANAASAAQDIFDEQGVTLAPVVGQAIVAGASGSYVAATVPLVPVDNDGEVTLVPALVGDFVLEVDAKFDPLQGLVVLPSIWNSAGGKRTSLWNTAVNAGAPRLEVAGSTDGSGTGSGYAGRFTTWTPGTYSVGSRFLLRVDRRASDGRLRFFGRRASDGVWEQIGTDKIGVVGPLFASNEPLTIGATSNGTTQYAGALTLYRVRAWSDLDMTQLVVDSDVPSETDLTGNAWTYKGTTVRVAGALDAEAGAASYELATSTSVDGTVKAFTRIANRAVSPFERADERLNAVGSKDAKLGSRFGSLDEARAAFGPTVASLDELLDRHAWNATVRQVGHVFMPARELYYDAPLDVVKMLMVQGAHRQRSILKAAPGYAFNEHLRNPDGSDQYHGIVVRDVTLDGSKAGNPSLSSSGRRGFYARQMWNSVLDFDIKNVRGAGMTLDGNGVQSRNNRVNVTITGCIGPHAFRAAHAMRDISGRVAARGNTIVPDEAAPTETMAAIMVDHSEAVDLTVIADANNGPGVRLRHVWGHLGLVVKATRNKGVGILADGYTYSHGGDWLAVGNMVPGGTYTPPRTFGSTEVYLDNLPYTSDYGITRQMQVGSVTTAINPTLGGTMQRYAEHGLTIASGVSGAVHDANLGPASNYANGGAPLVMDAPVSPALFVEEVVDGVHTLHSGFRRIPTRTTATRPSASAVGKGVSIFNETTGLLETSDGTSWTSTGPGPAGSPGALSGNGSPEGSVTAAVGTIYTDATAALGVGIWRKATNTGNTGWVPLSADTGWRSMPLTNGWAGTLYMRRRNDIVEVSVADLVAGSSATLVTVPAGFVSKRTFNIGHRPATGTSTVWGNVAPSGAVQLNTTTALSANGATWSWSTTDPWPTSLPGVAV